MNIYPGGRPTAFSVLLFTVSSFISISSPSWPAMIAHNIAATRMWANAQRDGRPAEHRWRPLFNVAKFG